MAEVQDVRSVLVTNISPSANEKTVSDFFSFCGKISKLFLKKEEGKDTSSAIIQFETESAAKTALLLTNALIVDRPITVTAYSTTSTQPTSTPTTTTTTTETTTTPVEVGKEVEASEINHKDFGGVHDDQRSKTSVVASLLAAGYVLAENALDKAKEYDDKTNFSSRAKVTVDQLRTKASEIDKEYGLTDKAVAVKNSVTETAKKIDSELGISDKAKVAASVIMSAVNSGIQSAQQNPTIMKSVDSVKSTAHQVSESVNQTFNEVKAQTNKEIENQEKKQQTNEENVTTAPTPVTMDPPVQQ